MDRLRILIDPSEPEKEHIDLFYDLVKHGYKTIDILVRKDGKEYIFEGDWIARLLRSLEEDE